MRFGTKNNFLICDNSNQHEHILFYTDRLGIGRQKKFCLYYILTGDIKYSSYGITHRYSGPAMIYENGAQVYYKDGNIHREDGPAKKFYSCGNLVERYFLKNYSYKTKGDWRKAQKAMGLK